jgi:antitoxin ParD1/3/4
MYMPTMIRKQVYIRPKQERLLKRLARKTGKTEAEIIRDAIDRQTEEF